VKVFQEVFGEGYLFETPSIVDLLSSYALFWLLMLPVYESKVCSV